MKPIKWLGLSAALLAAALAGVNTANAQWTGVDVGAPGMAGSATVNADGTITIDGGGGDIWNTSDQMFYYYQNVTGIWWDATVNVISLACASSTWAKTELMAREDDGSMAPSGPDPFICAMTTSNGAGCQNEVADQFRPSPAGTGANWIENSPTSKPTYPNTWMRMERIGPLFNVYFGTDGKTWSKYFSQDTSTTANGFDGNAWSNRVLIGIAVTAHNNGALTTTVISNLTLTVHTPVNPTVLATQTQLKSETNYAYGEASFTFVATNNAAPQGLYPNSYAWYKNGQLQSNVVGQNYTFLATPADNAAQVYCVATTPGYNLTLNSATGTVTVLSPTLYTNGVKVERFLNKSRTDVESDSTARADNIRVSTQDLTASPLDYTGFENILNDGVNNQTERLSGWFIPPTTGNYVFFVASDDDADLFLSTDNTPLNKQLIAQESNWGNSREWTDAGVTNATADAGGSLLSQKRSDQWTNALGVAPFTNGIALTAGTSYYIEAIHHQGGGGENVGVTYKLVGAADPTNGAPPIPSSQLVVASYPPTSLTWVTNPQPVSVFEGGLANFTALAKSDSEFLPVYQWQRYGTNIPGATSTGFSFTTILADNGSTVSVIAGTQEGGLRITNSAAVTVQQAAFELGLALMQYWPNQGAASPEGTPPLGTPAFVMAVPAFEAGVNNENGDSYVNEVNGFFIPAVTGTYDFICTGDDFVDLFLSTDSNPNNKRLICQQTGWSNALTWSTDNGGGNDLTMKHSATWSNNAAGVATWANGFNLTAGTKYYIEMWHHEGTGGDSCAATYTIRSGGVVSPDPPDGTDSAITGNQLGFNTPAAHEVDFTAQPTNETALSGTTATFSAGGHSDGNVPVGTTGLFEPTGGLIGATNFLSFPVVLFQWYKNGTLIPGATMSTYTTPLIRTNDNKAQFVAAIRALGYPTWSNSVPAVLTVITDTNRPTFTADEFTENGLPVVSVSFSKVMDPTSVANPANYSIAGATVTGVLVDTNDYRHVQLQLAAAPTTLPAQLTISGITDYSGNSPTTTTATVAADELTNADIGDPQIPDPAWPGYMWGDGAHAYTVECQGSDIWNAADGFNFSYEILTNDFDVVVRQISFTKVSNWSKGGLMAREDLTPGSRDWNIINDPTSADGVPSIDGSGNGANTVEANARQTALATSGGWGIAGGTIPNYPNAWVRLKRTGQILQSYWSSNGTVWSREGYADVSTNAAGPLPANMYVGICCTAHNNNGVTATVLNYYYTASFANYNSAYIAPTNTPQATLTASISGANVVISWTPAGGTLQSSPAVGTSASWSPVGTANPATIPLSSATDKFFRVGP